MQRVNVVFYVHEQGMRGNNTLFILLADVEELIKYVSPLFSAPFPDLHPNLRPAKKPIPNPPMAPLVVFGVKI
jgi:hypothetical protein